MSNPRPRKTERISNMAHNLIVFEGGKVEGERGAYKVTLPPTATRIGKGRYDVDGFVVSFVGNTCMALQR